MGSTLCKQLKVIEFASVLAGPLVGRFFAEHGAEVIKIENKRTNGDVTRGWRTSSETGEFAVSAYYASANYNKRSIFLDLRVQEDLQYAKELCRDADIILSNFKEASAKKLGLDFFSLKKWNPHMIYGQINGYAQQKDKPAFDMLLQAETGYLAMTGFQDRPYAKIPVAMIDQFAAHQLIEGIQMALWARKDKNAILVEVDLYQSALSALINQASAYLMNQDIPQPMGSQHPSIAPYGSVYITADGQAIVIAAGTDRQFEALQNLLKIDDPGSIYGTNQLRVNNREALDKAISEKIKNWDFGPLEQKLEEYRVPFAKVKAINEALNQSDANYIKTEIVEGRSMRSIQISCFTMNN
jgi:crotonobetainyl-CoA:carnitine CoA-transferase CaiB-like acyl-CoA transferase